MSSTESWPRQNIKKVKVSLSKISYDWIYKHTETICQWVIPPGKDQNLAWKIPRGSLVNFDLYVM